jgi:hypothetical protein
MTKYLLWIDTDSGDHWPIGYMDHSPSEQERRILTSKAFVGDDGWDMEEDNVPADGCANLSVHEIDEIDFDNPPFKYDEEN